MTNDTQDEKGGGLIGFLKEYWLWWLAPLVIAAVLVVWLLWFSEGKASSPFVYDSY